MGVQIGGVHVLYRPLENVNGSGLGIIPNH